jgi:hypothetical protein
MFRHYIEPTIKKAFKIATKVKISRLKCATLLICNSLLPKKFYEETIISCLATDQFGGV